MNLLYDDHHIGDFDCPMCDKPPRLCDNCGGVVHFIVNEIPHPTYGFVKDEESECDSCGEEFLIYVG